MSARIMKPAKSYAGKILKTFEDLIDPFADHPAGTPP